jgi:hypothetical protein
MPLFPERPYTTCGRAINRFDRCSVSAPGPWCSPVLNDALGETLVGSEDRVIRDELQEGVEIASIPVLEGLAQVLL